MTELGKSLINEGKDEGKKEKTIEIVKKAIKKGMDNETIKELTEQKYLRNNRTVTMLLAKKISIVT